MLSLEVYKIHLWGDIVLSLFPINYSNFFLNNVLSCLVLFHVSFLYPPFFSHIPCVSFLVLWTFFSLSMETEMMMMTTVYLSCVYLKQNALICLHFAIVCCSMHLSLLFQVSFSSVFSSATRMATRMATRTESKATERNDWSNTCMPTTVMTITVRQTETAQEKGEENMQETKWDEMSNTRQEGIERKWEEIFFLSNSKSWHPSIRVEKFRVSFQGRFETRETTRERKTFTSSFTLVCVSQIVFELSLSGCIISFIALLLIPLALSLLCNCN